MRYSSLLILLLLLCSSISCTNPAVTKAVPVDVKIAPHVYSTGDGDNFNQTWAADDNIYINCDDGEGWEEEPRTSYNCRVYRLSGGPEPLEAHFLAGYPNFLRDEKRTHGRELLAELEQIKEYYNHRVD